MGNELVKLPVVVDVVPSIHHPVPDVQQLVPGQGCGCWVEMHEIMDPDYDLFDDIEMTNWNVRGWTCFQCTSATEDAGWMEELVPQEKILDAVRNKRKGGQK